MESENRIVKELVGFVREQRDINRELRGMHREQQDINRRQKEINERLEVHVREERRFMEQSERRFRAFYSMITDRLR